MPNKKHIWACFTGAAEIIGFTRTAEHACEWASQRSPGNKNVIIIKIYEMPSIPKTGDYKDVVDAISKELDGLDDKHKAKRMRTRP